MHHVTRARRRKDRAVDRVVRSLVRGHVVRVPAHEKSKSREEVRRRGHGCGAPVIQVIFKEAPLRLGDA